MQANCSQLKYFVPSRSSGVHTSLFHLQNGRPPPPPYGHVHSQSSHSPSLANGWGPLLNSDRSNKEEHSGLEYTVELNGYAEFGPFPPSCTSRGTSTAKDTETLESSSGTHTYKRMIKYKQIIQTYTFTLSDFHSILHL